MTHKILFALLAGAIVMAPGLAQSQNGASVSVQAGPLQGSAGAGQTDRAGQNRAASARHDTGRQCERVTVRSGNGSSSASASVSSSGGSTALAAGGSPDARTEFSDCSPAPTETREASSGRGVRHEDRP
jgi:hypothetical protein